ncbi:hypothetical protein J1N35_002365 [Gossypium stocksii]|uniref:Reverse transcriptase domain-containing protein n=1 Tax=Gossypium stocksii TaxID=47602 RepID=A0A9D3WKU5_9ROSI|nr:hypothetical protein J1N35_002365 [Gossypium stocksii]
MSIIRNRWGLMGNLNGKVSGKLKKLKGVLRKWNGEERYTLDRRFNEIEARIRCLDDCSDVRELFELELEELKNLNLEMGMLNRLKESIWRQKLRMTWLKIGDSNTAFFHRAVKFKAKRKTVCALDRLDSGVRVYGEGSSVVNGAITNEFRMHRGLWQGDHLSPFLFILVTEVLHLMFEKVDFDVCGLLVNVAC